MHTLLIIVTIHVLLFAFAFLLSGWATLFGGSPEELAAYRTQTEEAQKQGLFAEWQAYSRLRSDFGSNQRLAANWRERPQARRFLLLGLTLAAIAAFLGIPLGAYHSPTPFRT